MKQIFIIFLAILVFCLSGCAKEKNYSAPAKEQELGYFSPARSVILNFASTDCIIVGDFKTNCWLYPLDGETEGSRPCVVIDPGGDAHLIIERLKEIDWVPRYIFLTHGHLDHIAALPDLIEAFEKGVFGNNPVPKVGIHRGDANYLGKNALKIHVDTFGGDLAYVKTLWKPSNDADILFEEGDEAGPFRVLHIPGHTPGSAGFYDEKEGVLFSGDTLFKWSRGRTDLTGGDEALMQESLKRLLSMQEETIVLSGHGLDTTIKDRKY